MRIDQGIKPVYKLVDTCAGEFEAETPYSYSTYESENDLQDNAKIVSQMCHWSVDSN